MKPFRRRRIPRHTYVPQIGFTAEPPLLLRRRRLGLPAKEDRLIYILIGRPSRLDQVYELTEERPMDLETLLMQLAALTEQAQRAWEAEQRADEDNEYDDGDEIEGTLWLALEVDLASPPGIIAWACGYRLSVDELTEWAFKQIGRTALDAAQALLKEIEPPRVPISTIMDQLADIHEERNPGGFS